MISVALAGFAGFSKVLAGARPIPIIRPLGRRSQVAKAADCKSAIVGPTPTGASLIEVAGNRPAGGLRAIGLGGLTGGRFRL